MLPVVLFLVYINVKTKKSRGILFLATNLIGALTMGREVIIRLVATESDN